MIRTSGNMSLDEDISDKAPLDLSQPSPSGMRQPHGVKAKKPNNFGFYRSGVWEWTENENRGSRRGLVGGSWRDDPERAASGFRISGWAGTGTTMSAPPAW